MKTGWATAPGAQPSGELLSATMADGDIRPSLRAGAAVLRSTADRFDAVLSDASLSEAEVLGRLALEAVLFVIDGGKALRRAIKDVFGERALVHRCIATRNAT